MSKYYFEGSVIKLNKKDYECWWQTFQHWKSEKEYLQKLCGIDEWLAKQEKVGNWFIQVSKMLDKEHQQMMDFASDIHLYNGD